MQEPEALARAGALLLSLVVHSVAGWYFGTLSIQNLGRELPELPLPRLAPADTELEDPPQRPLPVTLGDPTATEVGEFRMPEEPVEEVEPVEKEAAIPEKRKVEPEQRRETAPEKVTEEKVEELKEEGGRRGDRLEADKAWILDILRTDQEETTLPVDSDYLSDRSVFEPLTSVGQASIHRALGLGDGDSDRILTHTDFFSQNTEKAPGIKRGGKKVTPGAPLTRQQVRKDATGSPVVIELPMSGGEGELSASDRPITLIREELPKREPRPRLKRRLPPSIVPTPTLEPVVDAPSQTEELPPPEPELPVTLDYFPDAPLIPWGTDVPEVLADPNPEAQAPEATAAWGEEEMLEFDGTPDQRTRLSTRKDPLGVWFIPLYDQIARLWKYPMELRALDISGRVELLVHYDRNGRLGLIQVREATYPQLVDSARDAIPEKVDPLPNEPAYKNGMDIRFVFVYSKR